MNTKGFEDMPITSPQTIRSGVYCLWYNLNMEEYNNQEQNNDEKFYLSLIQDYANKPMILGSAFSLVKEDPEQFRKWMDSHPSDSVTLSEYYADHVDGFKKYFETKLNEIDFLVNRLKTEDNPIVIKRIINKLLKIIYPKRSTNDWFDGEEFSSDKL